MTTTDPAHLAAAKVLREQYQRPGPAADPHQGLVGTWPTLVTTLPALDQLAAANPAWRLEIRVLNFPIGLGGLAFEPGDAKARLRVETYPFKTPETQPHFVVERTQAVAQDGAMFLLEYDLVADYLERRSEFREDHLALATEAAERGELVLGGALADPADRAILVWRVADQGIVEEFVRADPYVINGLVRSWSIRSWTVVIGTAA